LCILRSPAAYFKGKVGTETLQRRFKQSKTPIEQPVPWRSASPALSPLVHLSRNFHFGLKLRNRDRVAAGFSRARSHG